MSTERIKFTVVIPTRERCDVLEWSLRTVTAQTYPNLEIIVSDNYSNDGTEKLVNNFNDSRIHYINTGKKINMSANWEFALSHISDGWVTIIGDDDGILSGSLEKVEKLIEVTGTKVIHSICSSYSWPSASVDKYWKLTVPISNGWEWRNSDEWLGKVIKGNGSHNDLPTIYHGGFVDYTILKEIKDKTGRFFNSRVPDIYSECAIPSVTKKYVFSFEPFIISGCSNHSNGAQLFKNTEEIKKIFLSVPNIPYHQDFPLPAASGYPPILHAVLYEGYLQTKSLRLRSKYEDHQLQLELFLMEAANRLDREEDLIRWCVLFADKHGLDIVQSKKMVNKHRLRVMISNLFEKLRIIRKKKPLSVIMWSNDSTISNIYDASIATTTIHALNLGIFKRFANRLKFKSSIRNFLQNQSKNNMVISETKNISSLN